MRWLLGLVLSLCLAFPTVAAERAILILDASGSMWAQLGGVPRIQTLRQTLDDVLAALPPGLELGLATYGHGARGSCSDIEVLVPPGADNGPAISYAAAGIIPQGKTPIAEALRKSAEALDYTKQKATVVLIADGLETCGGDPCAVARELERSGRDFTAHVVGFGLSEVETHQLACIADLTGGRSFAGPDNAALRLALSTSMYAAANVEMPPPPPEPLAINFDPDLVLAEGAAPLPADAEVNWEIRRPPADGYEGDYVTGGYGLDYAALVEPGDYVVRAKLGYAIAEAEITIDAFTLAAPRLVLDAGRLTVRPVTVAGGEAEGNAAVSITLPSGEAATSYGETTAYVPSGDIGASVTIGRGEASETIRVAAGAELTKEILVSVGHVTLAASYVEGMKVEDSGLNFSIVAAAADIQGYREEVGSAYGTDAALDLPPGDYVAVVTYDQVTAEAPFTVTAGRDQAVDIVLEAGVLAAKSAGADGIEIFDSYDRQLGYGYGEERTATVPAGEYRLVARRPDGSERQATARVTPGQRTEITIK
jgi:Ca-activated chloride channel family protein